MSLDFTPPSLPDVVAKVREIATANPDFVYATTRWGSCVYVKDGVGSCLVGRALIALGVPLDFFTAEDESGRTLNGCAITLDIARLLGWPTGEMLTWLRGVQARQDGGVSWGAAVAQADQAYPLTPAAV